MITILSVTPAILLFLDTDRQIQIAFILTLIASAVPSYFAGRVISRKLRKAGNRFPGLAGVLAFLFCFVAIFFIIVIIILSQMEFRR
ncbi:hypothetical protein [Mucilaginibacter pedocola]|nr:hypothetical protein [Mucilaginibacter pedocola]